MSQQLEVNPGRVVVSGETLVISDLIETDTEVVGYIADSDDPIEATRKCLRIGARSIRAASATLDAETVTTRFEALGSRFDTCVTDAVEKVVAAAVSLADSEGGALVLALAEHKGQLEEMLDDNFDLQSKVSVMGKIEQMIAEAQTRQNEALKRVLSLDTTEGPLHVLKTEILGGVAGPIADLKTRVGELSEKIAVNAAVAPVVAITTAKGFTFEDVVHDRVATIAAQHGDTAEKVGRVAGVSGSQKGDELVTLNTEDTFGAERHFVLEAKTRRLSARHTNSELEEALVNRNAAAAIAVFDDRSKAPSSVPFQYSDNKAIVVLDDDTTALRLGYMWARWVVRREEADDAAATLDHARIADLLDKGRRAIDRHSSVKRFHTQAKNAIGQAASQVSEMVGEVDEILTDLEHELRATPEQEEHRAAS